MQVTLLASGQLKGKTGVMIQPEDNTPPVFVSAERVHPDDYRQLTEHSKEAE
jgi:cold shock CspA family protein